MYENTWSGDLTQHILSHEYPKAKTKHSEGTRRLTNPVYTSGLWRAKSVRLQPPSLDRKGLVTQAKDCDPSNNLLDPLFVLAGERGRARAIAIAPTPVDDDPRGALRAKRERSNGDDPRGALRAKRERASNDGDVDPPRRIASEARAGVERRRRRPPRRIASEARAGVERRRPPRRIASEARAPATQPPGAIAIAASATGRSTKRGSRRWLKEQFEPV
jgi:hypothetical protein